MIERKEKSSKKWTKMSKDSIKVTSFQSGALVSSQMTKLTAKQVPSFVDDKVLPRKDYEYRVFAVNEGGESEPSDSSGLITARPEKGKLRSRIAAQNLSPQVLCL